ncbi:hypothetical protein F3J16_05250 [Burkholderia sp. Ap-962]|uniref:hypothetical protein n=1 Tax=Burkholderia sp. Ap-962 TaxID=2608333 RepID=UPI00142400A7|nr:hypothetical protein [Burkholderia sp. Ap-962]NIF69601.1 hypothetical protein [Burkholderia sp. Ap-962]
MDYKHVTSAGLSDRLTIDEAADFVVKETEKPRDYVVSFLTDCAEHGYFLAEVVSAAGSENVSDISRVDSSKSTLSSAALIEWLNDEIEGAHQRARVAIARKETDKWGYLVKPEDARVHLISWPEQLDDISRDENISMSPRNWVEYLSREVVERQQWGDEEREAKLPVVRAEFLNLFVRLSDTLPLCQELTGTRWKGDDLPDDWLSRFLVSKTDLRGWAASHAPEISSSQLLAVSAASQLLRTDGHAFSGASTVPKPSKPLPVQQHQEKEILRVLHELGYNPLALPKRVNGNRWVAAKVRDKLVGPKWTKSIHDKAWERLRKNGDIKETE